MFEQILKEIRSHNRIIIHRHSSPDGDALGSQIGLKHILLENFPDKQVLMVGDAAGRYSFMADSVMDNVSDELFSDALSVILDTSARALISDTRYGLAHSSIRIDHHLFCEKIAPIEVTDSSFESCCGLIAAFAMECGLRLTPVAAQSLYTGMITDSGRFRYDSTSAKTFRLAAFLMEQPIDTNELYKNLYANDFEQMRLRAQFTLKIRFTDEPYGGVAYIYTTLDELRACGADTFTVSRGMVGTMSDIRGVDVWVNFTETETGVICEIRSSRYNINPIAVKYGGGGHAKASGATVPDYDTAMLMLADLRALTKENV